MYTRSIFVFVILYFIGINPAVALMAGTLPDTPAARVDANVASSPWAGVGSVVVGGNPYSGVAISSHYVLTAAHVAGGSAANPGAIQFVLNLDGAASQTLVADRVELFPTQNYPYDDLALIHLHDALPGKVPVYPIYDSPTGLGDIYTLVGYGASGNGDVGVSVPPSATVKRKGENSIDHLPTALDASGRSGAFFLYDFDGATGNSAMGGPTLGNARETMVASGDSGSGAFVQVGTRWALAGINTFAVGQAVANKFGNGGGGILLSDPRYLAWLRDKTQGEATMASDLVADSSMPVPAWALVMVGATIIGVSGRFRTHAN